MLFEDGDRFQSRAYGGTFRGLIQLKFFLCFEGAAKIKGGVLELAAD